MSYYIGLDLGTGAIKGVLVDENLELISTASSSLRTFYPEKGWAEQDPDDWWLGIKDVINKLITKADKTGIKVEALSISAQMIGVLPLSKEGSPLTRCIIWLDNRAEEEADEILGEFGVDELLDHVGGVPGGKDALPKILWLKNNKPDIYDDAEYIMDVKDYIIYKMTGEVVTDYACASVRGTFDMNNLKYSDRIAEIFNLDIEKYPEFKGALDVVGHLSSDAANELGLDEDTIVVNGSGDVIAASIGTGAVSPGDTHLYIGSSAWISTIVEERMLDAEHGMGTILFTEPNLWIFIGEMESAGAAYKWFIDTFISGISKERDPYSYMDGLIKASSPGANKVIFLPWMYGERAPIPDIYARGCFFNLSLDHKISDVARALVEGIGFNLRWISELVEENTGVSHDYFPASGGFLRSRTVSEVITDVLQKEIRVVRDIVESVAEGAALMAMVGAGKYHSLAEAVQNIRYQYHYHPNEEYEEVYGELYEVYKEMHDYLADAYAALNG